MPVPGLIASTRLRSPPEAGLLLSCLYLALSRQKLIDTATECVQLSELNKSGPVVALIWWRGLPDRLDGPDFDPKDSHGRRRLTP